VYFFNAGLLAALAALLSVLNESGAKVESANKEVMTIALSRMCKV
jgi:hypothetical protein